MAQKKKNAKKKAQAKARARAATAQKKNSAQQYEPDKPAENIEGISRQVETKPKKEQAPSKAVQKTKTKSRKERAGISEYFKGVKLEMKKVVWPTRKELGSYTAIVIATCAAFALMFWGIDSGVLAAIKALCF